MAEDTLGEQPGVKSGTVETDESVDPGETDDTEFQSAAMSDQPTSDDLLDFERYVIALETFLLHPNTKPPLTVSIEGGWGAGKSSFMKQLRELLESSGRDVPEGAGTTREGTAGESTAAGRRPSGRLRKQLTDEGHVTVEFNPWRHEDEDALWAAFMMSFLQQVRRQRPPLKRWLGHVRLVVARLDVRKGTSDLSVKAVALVLSALLFPLALLAYGPSAVASIAGIGTEQATDISRGASGLAFLFGGWLVKSNVVQQTESELVKYLANPEYERRVSFIERVHEDIKRVLDAYVGDERVFVFIDDLDRCEVPQSAELMQAINLMLATDDRMVFLLGLDREKVAAGVAVKNESSLKYLAPEVGTGYGLTYGYNYLEKFIQIPFQVPTPRGEHIVTFTDELLAEEGEATGIGDAGESITVVGWERGRVILIVLWVAEAMEYNPRRIKRFLNLYRLRALIAQQAELLGDGETDGQITLQQLGKFVAISLQWPRLFRDLGADPTLLADAYGAAFRRDLELRWRESLERNALVAEGEAEADSDDEGADGESTVADVDGDETDEVVVNPVETADEVELNVSVDDPAEAADETNADEDSNRRTADGNGLLSHLSGGSRSRLDDLLLAGLYDDTPPGFEDLSTVIETDDFVELAGEFSEPDFSRLAAAADDVPAAIRERDVQELEALTGANTAYSVAGVDVEALLRISPRPELSPETLDDSATMKAQSSPGAMGEAISVTADERRFDSTGLRDRLSNIRKGLFTMPRITGPFLVVDASVQTINSALGRQGYAPNWDDSTHYRGEVLNLASRYYDEDTGVPEVVWWQTHVRGWTGEDGIELQSHREPDPSEHPDEHRTGRGLSVDEGTTQLGRALDAEGVPYRMVDPQR